MDLQKLFQLQKELDEHIMNKHPEMRGQNNLDWKTLALQVELGELANEWRGFKKWSNKPASEKKIILEEYVDGIHFLLSIGLEMGINEIEIAPIKRGSITEQFIDLYGCMSRFTTHFSNFGYSTTFSAYIGLGEMLGFTWEEIEQEYIHKNEVNHRRQEGGY